jgi:hypothetical protein
MAGKNTAAFGIYPNEASLRIGIEALQRDGFRVEDISVLFPGNKGTKDFAHEKGTKAPEGAATGGGSALRYPAWGHFSLRVQSWQRWPAPGWVARSAD